MMMYHLFWKCHCFELSKNYINFSLKSDMISTVIENNGIEVHKKNRIIGEKSSKKIKHTEIEIGCHLIV